MSGDEARTRSGHHAPTGFDSRRLVLILGAPRSGTTWLSRMLGDHPAIAALPNELALFSAYLSPARAAFARELKARNEPIGLPALFTQQEFDEVLRDAVAAVYSRVGSTRPEASLVLDKHPGYTHHWETIEALAPGCRYIHLVRDGRDAVASMLRVPELMGSSGASVQTCAGEWATCVHRGQELAYQVGLGRCLTLRYEQLLADPTGGLAEAMRFLGVPADEVLLAGIAERHHHSRRLVSRGVPTGKEPHAEAWRLAFTLPQRYWIERIAGVQLRRLGYASERWWAYSALDRLRMAGYPLRVKLHDSFKALWRIWSKPMTRSVGTR
jgi:hypothetical protein